MAGERGGGRLEVLTPPWAAGACPARLLATGHTFLGGGVVSKDIYIYIYFFLLNGIAKIDKF